MAAYDLVIRGGEIITAEARFHADLAIRDGKIAAHLQPNTPVQTRDTLDAHHLLVLPGGVDAHCHIEQLQPDGTADEESWETGSRSALAGGTTTVISFAAQFKGRPIGETLAEYHRRARRAMVDYSFHQIITDPSDHVIQHEVPAIVASGVRSLKVFMTYDDSRLNDRQYLRVLAAARRCGALVAVHAENDSAIGWLTEALMAAGYTAPKYHAWARPQVVEREATHRAIALAELVDQPIHVFHVSCPQAAHEIARARARGVKVWGETCPQYLVLDANDMDRPGFEGAKFMCSPAPRDATAREGLWDDIRQGTLDTISSDHSGWSFDAMKDGKAVGKRVNGAQAPFRDIPNGVPGLAARMALLFSEGVATGRITPSQFVALTATNPARLYGLHPRKGHLNVGADADVVLWDAKKHVTLSNAHMQHVIDYTPYEGRTVTGWPVAVIRRGELAMRDNTVIAQPGSGCFLPREPYPLIQPRGVLANDFDASHYLG